MAGRRLPEEQIKKIRALYRAGIKTREIARVVGVGKNSVWRWTSDLQNRWTPLTWAQIRGIREGFLRGKRQREIAAELGIHETTVERRLRRFREAEPGMFPKKFRVHLARLLMGAKPDPVLANEVA